MMDLVSVIMSTYNENEEQLSASIESILNQSYKNIEFLIVNDNPRNKDLRVLLAKYAQLDERIIIVENPENIGLINSLNKAISLANGKYIARMDADDIARPERIQLQMDSLKNNGLDFIGGYIHLISEDGTPRNRIQKFPVRHHQIRQQMPWGSCIPHPTWLLKREVYETLGGYRQIPCAEDYDFILRALKANFHLGNIPCVVLDYRIRTTGISVSNRLKQDATRYYLAANRQNILDITEAMVAEQVADNENPYYLYTAKKTAVKCAIKSRNVVEIGICGCRLLVDKHFWFWLIEKIRSYIYR